MKKRVLIVAAVVLLAVLFLPIPQASYDDGGTREYIALTYKIVDWNKITDKGIFKKTSIYFGEDRHKAIDQLYLLEFKDSEKSFVATVLEINQSSVLVKPAEGAEELRSSDKITFSIKDFEDIGAKVGSTVEITYTGDIMETYPATITATGWKLSENPEN